jgi:hypothetical protein
MPSGKETRLSTGYSTGSTPPAAAFHNALKELERLEARDQDAVVVSPESVSPVTQTPETQLQILGSLRKNESADPAAGEMPHASPETPFLE